jgi:hypothetical protein
MKPNRISLVRKITIIAIGIALAIIILFCIKNCVEYTYAENTYTVELLEIDNNTFAVINEVISAIPAENYTLITVCDTKGNMHSIKGKCNIVIQNDVSPYAVIVERNIINSDGITLYIPMNSIKVSETKTIY